MFRESEGNFLEIWPHVRAIRQPMEVPSQLGAPSYPEGRIGQLTNQLSRSAPNAVINSHIAARLLHQRGHQAPPPTPNRMQAQLWLALGAVRRIEHRVLRARPD